MENKIVQRAIVMILERIYEVDFCDTSYGYRPGRSCHQALADLGQIITRDRVNLVYDADISGFFDSVNHGNLIELLGQRIEEARMLRLIMKFLKSGVIIQDTRHDTDGGVAQGSVLSLMLANVYLHYVRDQWFRTKLTTPISEVWSSLASKLQGHFHCFHVNDNWQMLMKYRETARRLGLRWMRRRSQKSASLSWSGYRRYLETYPLPMPGRLTDLIAMTRAQ